MVYLSPVRKGRFQEQSYQNDAEIFFLLMLFRSKSFDAEKGHDGYCFGSVCCLGVLTRLLCGRHVSEKPDVMSYTSQKYPEVCQSLFYICIKPPLHSCLVRIAVWAFPCNYFSSQNCASGFVLRFVSIH